MTQQYNDLIGQNVEILDGNNNTTGQFITITKVKTTPNNNVIFFDENDIPYTEPELNLEYRLSPEYILYKTLSQHNLNPPEDMQKMEQIFSYFMNEMIKAGYIQDNTNTIK